MVQDRAGHCIGTLDHGKVPGVFEQYEAGPVDRVCDQPAVVGRRGLVVGGGDDEVGASMDVSSSRTSKAEIASQQPA